MNCNFRLDNIQQHLSRVLRTIWHWTAANDIKWCLAYLHGNWRFQPFCALLWRPQTTPGKSRKRKQRALLPQTSSILLKTPWVTCGTPIQIREERTWTIANFRLFYASESSELNFPIFLGKKRPEVGRKRDLEEPLLTTMAQVLPFLIQVRLKKHVGEVCMAAEVWSANPYFATPSRTSAALPKSSKRGAQKVELGDSFLYTSSVGKRYFLCSSVPAVDKIQGP